MNRRGALHLRQTRAAKLRRRKRARRFLLGLLDVAECTDCHLRDPLVLEFDHVREGKRETVAELVTHGFSLWRIVEEIDCCEVVCTNCHRRRTAFRSGCWRLDPQRRIAFDKRALRRRNLLHLAEVLQRSSCADCGEEDIVVLDFDHVGEKRRNVVDLVWGEHSLAAIEREISCCEVRCANCHRRRTGKMLGHFRHHLSSAPVAQR
jgi:hypothetical protein